MNKRKKFTLYQASKYTGISRYKLEQAISNGVLACCEGDKNIKCFILKDELQRFLEKHGDDYRRFDYDSKKKSLHVSHDINQYISLEVHDQIVKEKNRVIELLEYQNQQLSTNVVPKNDRNDIKEIMASVNQWPDSKSDIKNQVLSMLWGLCDNEST